MKKFLVEQAEDGSWAVSCIGWNEDRFDNRLGWDEALGVCASIILSLEKQHNEAMTRIAEEKL